MLYFRRPPDWVALRARRLPTGDERGGTLTAKIERLRRDRWTLIETQIVSNIEVQVRPPQRAGRCASS
jgi:hypothetical protein